LQVARIKRAKGHALAAVVGHVQAVVPVCAFQQNRIVLADVVKRRQVLNQQMLQHASRDTATRPRAQHRPLLRRPVRVGLFTAMAQVVFEIALLAQ
jgi:hypothetical protein